MDPPPEAPAVVTGPVQRAWPTLPPIQRTTDTTSSVVGPEVFVAGLTTRQDPRFLQPLAHNVASTAPSGHVEGVATVAPAPVQRTLFGAPPAGSAGAQPSAAPTADASAPTPPAPEIAPAERAEAEAARGSASAAPAAPIEATAAVPGPQQQATTSSAAGTGSLQRVPEAGLGRSVQRELLPDEAAAQTAHRHVPARAIQVQRSTGRVVPAAAPAESPSSPPVAESLPIVSVDRPGEPDVPVFSVEPSEQSEPVEPSEQSEPVEPVERVEPAESVRPGDIDAPTPDPGAEPHGAGLIGSGPGINAPQSDGPAVAQAAIQRAVDPMGPFEVAARHAVVEAPPVSSSEPAGSGSASSGAQAPLGRHHPDAAAVPLAPAEPQGSMSHPLTSHVTSPSAPAPPALQRSLIPASTSPTETWRPTAPALSGAVRPATGGSAASAQAARPQVQRSAVPLHAEPDAEPSQETVLLGERLPLAASDPTPQTPAAEPAYPSTSTSAHRESPAAPPVPTRTLPRPPIPLSVSRVPLEPAMQTPPTPAVQRVSFGGGGGRAGGAEPPTPRPTPGPALQRDPVAPPPAVANGTSARTVAGWTPEVSSPAVPVQRLAVVGENPGPPGSRAASRVAMTSVPRTATALQRVTAPTAGVGTTPPHGRSGTSPHATTAADQAADGSGFTVVDVPSDPDLRGVQRLPAPRYADQPPDHAPVQLTDRPPDRPAPAPTDDSPAAGGGDGSLVSVQTSSEVPVQSAAAAPAAPAASADAAGADDLDELARRLYEPLSARLRAELWLDRERSGRSLTR